MPTAPTNNLPYVLFASCFTEPEPTGGNRTVAMQLSELRRRGFPVEVFTWPFRDTWVGPIPAPGGQTLAGVPYLTIERVGARYHVVSLPTIRVERFLTEREWDDAVSWGVEALKVLRPSLVHLQFWQSMWWILEAAQRLEIPTAYSVHDYGMACCRTILVNGWDELCDAVTGPDKCSRCVLAGRGLVGKANEYIAQAPFADRLLSKLFGPDAEGPLARFGGVRMPVRRRVGLTLERCHRVLSKLDALVAPSPFARDFFLQFGTKPERAHVIPWFYSQKSISEGLPEPDGTLRLGMATRVSHEKGVHVVLKALERVHARRPVSLKIAGAIDSDYARNLMRDYPERAGEHLVHWVGWLPNDALAEFYTDVEVAVVPSLWYDNTPLTLVEALAHGRPVICTDVPSMTHIVHHDVNGLTFPMGDVNALARAIERLAENPDLVPQMAGKTRNVSSLEDYCGELLGVYGGIPGIPAAGTADDAAEEK